MENSMWRNLTWPRYKGSSLWSNRGPLLFCAVENKNSSCLCSHRYSVPFGTVTWTVILSRFLCRFIPYVSAEVAESLRFEVFTTMTIQALVSWVVTQCSDVIGYQRFGRSISVYLPRPSPEDHELSYKRLFLSPNCILYYVNSLIIC